MTNYHVRAIEEEDIPFLWPLWYIGNDGTSECFGILNDKRS